MSLRNVKSEEQARVSSGRLFHARAAATGKARSPMVARRVDGTCSVVVSAERRHRRATISDVARRLSDRYVGAVPCTQWYVRTHNRNYRVMTPIALRAGGDLILSRRTTRTLRQPHVLIFFCHSDTLKTTVEQDGRTSIRSAYSVRYLRFCRF